MNKATENLEGQNSISSSQARDSYLLWFHLTGIGVKAYYIVICRRLIIGTFWAQPINILSREEQDFTSQDANSH